MKFAFYGVLLALASLADVNSANVNLRIPFGGYASLKEFPWMLRFGNGNVCGASLVKLSPTDTESDVALTAAHCITKCMDPEKPCCWLPKPNTTYVRYGSVELDGGTVVRVKRVHTYSDNRYAPGTQDFAVLKLREKIKFNDVVTGVRIPDKDGAEPAPGDKCMFSGWGTTENNKISSKLKKVEFKIHDPCEKMQKHPGRFCGRSVHERAPSCTGDSGGPAVCQGADGVWTQYGVLIQGKETVVPGSSNCADAKTSVFTRVSGYLKWIHEVAKSDSATCP